MYLRHQEDGAHLRAGNSSTWCTERHIEQISQSQVKYSENLNLTSQWVRQHSQLVWLSIAYFSYFNLYRVWGYCLAQCHDGDGSPVANIKPNLHIRVDETTALLPLKVIQWLSMGVSRDCPSSAPLLINKHFLWYTCYIKYDSTLLTFRPLQILTESPRLEQPVSMGNVTCCGSRLLFARVYLLI